MRALFFIGEFILTLLLILLLFVTLMWQPRWIAVMAAIMMVALFVAIGFLGKRPSRITGFLIFLCPSGYSIWLLGVAVSVSVSAGGIDSMFVVAGFYAAGALLLWLQLLLNQHAR